MSRQRSARPRYGRIAWALAALAVTAFSVLGGVGLVPPAPSAAQGDRQPAPSSPTTASTATVPAPVLLGPSAPAGPAAEEPPDPDALPADSGTGRRIVFAEAAQRVWLVRSNGSVRHTYLVSGSTEDNLAPGTYSVFSRSRWAVGVDDSGVMEFFVRFAHGQRAAIGFHTIPTKLGTPLQSRAQLGTPLSHGCIRQAEADAISLWRFAPEGTPVVVV